MRATVLVLLIVCMTSQEVVGQGATVDASRPAFEVASIRPQKDNRGRTYFRMPPNGLMSITNAPLRDIVARAYGIPFELIRLTILTDSAEVTKVLDARFDIQAKPPDHAPPGQQLTMLRTLLDDRFSLRAGMETREIPVYALTVVKDGRLGSDIRRSGADCDAFMAARKVDRGTKEPRDVNGDPVCTQSYEFNVPTPGAYKMRDAGSIDRLVRRLQGFVDRPVVDATGLTGNYDWVISFSNNRFDPDLPSIFQALQDGLGLKLEHRTSPVEVLVVHAAKMPAPD